MNLIKSTGTFSFFTLISRISGYFRDFLIAIYLGAGPVADAFFVAFRIPNTFRRLFSEGTFNSAFVPSYKSELIKGKKKGEKFANSVFNILVISLLGIVFLIEIFMPLFVSIIAPGFRINSEKIELAILLTRITFPFLFLVSLSSFFSAILNSHNKFAVASATPIILNIILVLVLLFGKILSDKLVFYLSYAVTFAGFVQLIFLIFFVKKYFVPKISFKLNFNKKIKLFFNKLFPSIFSSGVTQINILIGTIIASFQANAVSYLYYADRIYQINLAVAGIAIGTVLLPNLSKYVENKNITKINLIQNKSLELSMFLSLPATAALLVAPTEITSALFGYGTFDKLSVQNTSLALFYFALGMPAFAFIKVFSSFLFARHNTKVPFYFSIVSVLINISISLYFFSSVGFVIIPIATTISSWINSFLLLFYLIKKNYFSFNETFIYKLFNISFLSILSAFIFHQLIKYFYDFLIYESNIKLLTIVFLVILTLLFYIIASLFTKAFKISDIKLKY
jgi:putative peptidoglycan lipid II flippase|tara:strand:+ start:858 stop:2387 length:1530 start_codon:yes stop_codon:yes gene_type:complete